MRKSRTSQPRIVLPSIVPQVALTKKTLPLELIDQVIDHLHNDRYSLKACSLVCRAWVPSSRSHFFHSIQLSFIFDRYKSRFFRFINLLEHPLCSFSASIQSLTITSDDDDGFGDSVYYPRDWLDVKSLILHIPKLTSLTTLVTYSVGCNLTTSSWASLIASKEFTARITDLTLDKFTSLSFEEHMASVAAFPSLVKLTYANDYSRFMKGDLTPSKRPASSLRVLDMLLSPLQLKTTQLMLRWLLRSQAVLHTIKVQTHDRLKPSVHFEAANFVVLASYFLFLASSLQVLKIEFGTGHMLSFLDNIDIRLNTGLQILEIKLSPTDFPALPRLFREVSGDALTTIKFTGFSSAKKDKAYPAEIWLAIDEDLSNLRFSCLKKLEFEVHVDYAGHDVFGDHFKTYLEVRLSNCIKRNVEICAYLRLYDNTHKEWVTSVLD